MSHQKLSVFVSSTMRAELAQERQAVRDALAEYQMKGWLWELDAGARPEPIDSTYLSEVAVCDIYIGLFWLHYGPYTIEEFEYARKLDKPCLIYEKHLELERRDPRLQAFLNEIERVKNPDGLTVCWFDAKEKLAHQVQDDVMRLLTTVFRETRNQPDASYRKMAPSVPEKKRAGGLHQKAGRNSIVVGTNSGSITQNNYGDAVSEDDFE